MKSELIVDVQASEVSIALLEDGRLVSLQKEQRNIAYAVGDIYLAKVKKLMPGLNAAFVNVGYEKDAFLHYLDLGPNFGTYSAYLTRLLSDRKRVPDLTQMKLLPEIDKHGSVTDTLAQGRELLVQIVKEPISSKGPRLTTELTFTGRYMVLTPFCDKISVSQKIKSHEEKLRLRKTIESIKERNYGVIIRTSAEGKNSAELYNEFKTLVKSFESSCAKAQKATAPALVFEEESRIVGMLRDVFSPSFENIYVNDPEVCAQIRSYVSLIAPDRADIVKDYSKPEPVFDHFGITRQIKSSFGKTVSFKNGAYIIIEHTEALHVIDVNSGNRTKATNDQETNALEVNLRAADEIARQLRLRDMGGIIVVDFIDMAKAEHRQQLYEHMREIMANDRARHNILPLSKFGLMQITRQRVRPALDITVAETCPSCFGKGEVQPSLLFTDTLFEKLEYIVNTLGLKDFTLYVHPYVEAYVKKGLFFTMYRTWRRKLGVSFKLMADQSLAYLEYKVVDKDRNVLSLRQEKDLDQSSTTKSETKARTRSADDAEEKTPKKKARKPEKAEKPASEKPEKPAPEKPEKPAPEKPEKPAPEKPEKAQKPAPEKPQKAARAPKPENPENSGNLESFENSGSPENPGKAVEPEAESSEGAEEGASEAVGEGKLSKSQRRRRARKRSKEAARVAAELDGLDIEGAEGQNYAESKLLPARTPEASPSEPADRDSQPASEAKAARRRPLPVLVEAAVATGQEVSAQENHTPEP